MGDFDPFTTKVGDIYDRDGRRVATVRSTELPKATGTIATAAFTIGIPVAIVVAVIAGLLVLGSAGINFFRFGTFNASEQSSRIQSEGGPEAYFAKHSAEVEFGAPRLSLTPGTEQSLRGNDQIAVTLSVTNRGTASHKVDLGVAVDFEWVSTPEGTGVPTERQISHSQTVVGWPLVMGSVTLPAGQSQTVTFGPSEVDVPNIQLESYNVRAKVRNLRSPRVGVISVDKVANSKPSTDFSSDGVTVINGPGCMRGPAVPIISARCTG